MEPYWIWKFIDGLPHLFSHKVKDELVDTIDIINYDNFTYDDIISTIEKLGISMSNDKKLYENN